jgi:hypothetical protein
MEVKKAMHATKLPNSEAAILSRVIQPENDNLSATAARALLKLHFSAEDQKRMHELAAKNQSGKLTAIEQEELHGYIRVGRFLDLIVAKARLSLKKLGHNP